MKRTLRLAKGLARRLKPAQSAAARSLGGPIQRALGTDSARFGPPKQVRGTAAEHIYTEIVNGRDPRVQLETVFPAKAIARREPVVPNGPIHFRFARELVGLQEAGIVARLEEGRVLGPTGIVVAHGDVLIREFAHEFGRERIEELSPFTTLRRPPLERLDAPLAVVATENTRNYFHWMLHSLPRFGLVLHSSYRDEVAHWYVDELARPFHQESLRAMGIDPGMVVEGTKRPHLQSPALIVPQWTSRNGHVADSTVDFLRGLFLPAELPPPTRRIYISRRDAPTRRVLREDDLVRALEPLGFETVSLDGMSIAEQAALFASAEAVVAPHGAALTNLAFCQRGAKALELFAPNFLLSLFWMLANLVGVEYGYVVGKGAVDPPPLDGRHNGDDIDVDPKAVLDGLRALGIA